MKGNYMKLINRFFLLFLLTLTFISAEEKKKALIELNTGTD